MNNLKKVLLINLGILLVYNALMQLLTLNDHSSHRGLGLLFGLALFIALHVLVLFIISIAQFIKGKDNSGRIFLITTIVILVIGFSTCFGGLALQESF